MTKINLEKKTSENERYFVSQGFHRCDGKKYYAVCRIGGHYPGCTEEADEDNFWVEFYSESVRISLALEYADSVAMEEVYAADPEEIRDAIQRFSSGEIKTFAEEAEEEKRAEERQAQEDLARLGDRGFILSFFEGHDSRASLARAVFARMCPPEPDLSEVR